MKQYIMHVNKQLIHLMDFSRELVPEQPHSVYEVAIPGKWGYRTLGDMVTMAMRLPHELREKATGFGPERYRYRRLNVGLHRYFVTAEQIIPGELPKLQDLRFADSRLSRKYSVEINLCPPLYSLHSPPEGLVVRYCMPQQPGVGIVRYDPDQLPEASKHIKLLLDLFEE